MISLAILEAEYLHMLILELASDETLGKSSVNATLKSSALYNF